MNCGIVDIGSNTIRCNVYHINNEGFHLLFSKKYTAGLASYLEDKKLSRQGTDKLIRTLKSIKLMTDQVDLSELYLFATAVLRKATNTEKILQRVHDELGLEIELLSEKEEAALGFLGIKQMINGKHGISCDIGGGSTEIVLFNKGKVDEIINLDEGSLSLFTEFSKSIVPGKKDVKQMRSFIQDKLSAYEDGPDFHTLIGIGGSVRAINNVIEEIYHIPKDDPIPVRIIKDLMKRFNSQDRDTIRMVLKIAPERIHTIIPGLSILLEICRRFSVQEIQVCEHGLREGYLIQKLEKTYEQL